MLKRIIVVGILFFILVLVNHFINLYILKSAIHDLQANAITNGSSCIDKWVQKRILEMQRVQNVISHKYLSNDKKEIQRIMNSSALMTYFSYMFSYYENDIVISSQNNKEQLSNDMLSSPLYNEAIKNNKSIITEPHISSTLGELAVSVCTPSKDKEGKIGILCGVIPFKLIEKEVLNIALPYKGKAFLIDENKKILVHHDHNQLFKTFAYKLNDNDKLVANTSDLNQCIFSLTHITHTKWYLVVQLDKDNVYERVNFQLLINFIIYGISLAIFIWLNLFYNRYQRQNEEKLKKAQTLLEHFMNYSDRGILIATDKNKIRFYNKRLTQLLNFEEDLHNTILFKESKLFQIFSLPVKKAIIKAIEEVKEKNKNHEKTFLFQDKTEKLYFFFTIIAVVNKKGHYDGTILFIKDVSEVEEYKKNEKEQEAIVFQQSKMADLGEMMGAISHQWRQPLNSVSILLGNLLQFKEMKCLDDETFKTNIEHALTNTHYLAKTIDTFLDFYRSDKKLESFDIVEAIKDTNFILEPYFKNSCINIEIVEDTVKYSCFNYKNEFQQIIASLLLNSRDALLESNSNEKMYIKISIKEKEFNYQISIEDNGIGIDLSIKEALFRPFKTTKGEKGTGTGLYLSKLIARKKLLGDLSLVSSQNPTVFKLSMLKNVRGH